jgi:uridine kinase
LIAFWPLFRIGLHSLSASCRKRAEIPIYSFAKHARQNETTSIYSPHVLILEGIFALYDPRVLELLDVRVKMLLLLGD